MRPETVLRADEGPRPVARPPYSVAFVLAGYLSADTVHGLFPAILGLPPAERNKVESRFGAAAVRPARSGIPDPRFHRVDDRETLDLIAPFASLSPPHLSSLSNWEWIDLASVIAGRIATAPLSDAAQRIPTSPTELELAKYSLLSCGHGSPRLQLDQNGVLTSDAHLAAALAQVQMEGSGVITARFRIQPLFTPIRVVVLRNRAIVVQGLERLALLASLGIGRALALVHYGYGVEMLQFPFSVGDDVLFGPAPPLVSEFADPDLAVSIPAPLVMSVTRFSSETLHIGG